MTPEQIEKAHVLVRQGVLPDVALHIVLGLGAKPPDTSRPVEPSTTPRSVAPPSRPPAASTTVTYPEQGCQINISDGPPKNG